MQQTADRYVPVDPQIRDRGIDETRSLSFCTPYGCSKGAADQYVLDYAHSFGLRAAVLRKSCIYGPRQFGTEDQGWVAHFLIRALRDEPITIYGDGHQVRDILHVRDAVAAYRTVLTNIDRLAGQAFNLGGGAGNAVSLRMVLDEIATLTGRPLQISYAEPRPGDQVFFVADSGAAGRADRVAPHDRLARRTARPRRLAVRGSRSSRHQAKAHQAAGHRMRVALVNPPWRFDGSIYFGCREPHLPLELGYAQALLRQDGHETLLIDCNLGTALRCRSLPGYRGVRRRDDSRHHGADLSVLALRPARTACAARVSSDAWPARRPHRGGRPARVGHARRDPAQARCGRGRARRVRARRRRPGERR